MKKFILSLVAIFFPWLVILFNDNPGGALLALALQATVIGWIPASMWAWREVHGKASANTATGKQSA